MCYFRYILFLWRLFFLRDCVKFVGVAEPAKIKGSDLKILTVDKPG